MTELWDQHWGTAWGTLLQFKVLRWLRARLLLLIKAASHHCRAPVVAERVKQAGSRKVASHCERAGGQGECCGEWTGKRPCFCVKCTMVNTGKLLQWFGEHVLLLSLWNWLCDVANRQLGVVFHGKAHKKGIGVLPNLNLSCRKN